MRQRSCSMQERQGIERSEVIPGNKCQRRGILEARNTPGQSAIRLSDPRLPPNRCESEIAVESGRISGATDLSSLSRLVLDPGDFRHYS